VGAKLCMESKTGMQITSMVVEGMEMMFVEGMEGVECMEMMCVEGVEGMVMMCVEGVDCMGMMCVEGQSSHSRSLCSKLLWMQAEASQVIWLAWRTNSIA
jgi:hypothetical protein